MAQHHPQKRRKPDRSPAAPARSALQPGGAAGESSIPGFAAPVPLSSPSTRWNLARRRALQALVRRAPWLVGVGLCAALLAGAWGYANTPYGVTIVLVRNTGAVLSVAPPAGVVATVESDVAQSLQALLHSESFTREAARAAGVVAKPFLPGTHPAASSAASSNLILLTATAATPQQAADFANALADLAVRLGAELQAVAVSRLTLTLRERREKLDRDHEQTSQTLISQHADGLDERLTQDTTTLLRQVAELATETEALRASLATADQQTAQLNREIARFNPALVSAREALDRALLRYTREHPRVKELAAALAALEEELAQRPAQTNAEFTAWGNPGAAMLYAQLVELRNRRLELDRQLAAAGARRQQLETALAAVPASATRALDLRARYQSLQEERRSVTAQLQSLEWLSGTSPVPYHRLRPAGPPDAGTRSPWQAAGGYGALGGLGALLLAALVCAGRAVSHPRIRTPEDLRGVTGLPVLAELGDLSRMDARERDEWAFRTLTTLRGSLSRGPLESLVCGFISSHAGEGRSTWIQLLAEAARTQGYQVVTVDAAASLQPASGSSKNPPSESSVTTEALPALVTSAGPLQLECRPGSMQLPRWQWTLEKCGQWQDFLDQCRSVDRLVLLVDLPPASVKEAIQLAAGLPHLVWLAQRGRADLSQTCAHLELLRHARCRFAGTVLNGFP